MDSTYPMVGDSDLDRWALERRDEDRALWLARLQARFKRPGVARVLKALRVRQ